MARPIVVFAAITGLFTTAELARAQTAVPGVFRKELVASGVLMLPRGEFQRALRTTPYGGGFHGLFAIGSGQASAGVDSQLMFYPHGPDGRQHEMMLTAHGLVRLHPRLQIRRRPYVEAIGGIKGFSAEADTRIGTFSYGVGAGLQFPRSVAREGTVQHETIEIGVRYLRGGGARLDYQRFAPSTHSVTVHLGWGLRF
jgi:hypothetical protein